MQTYPIIEIVYPKFTWNLWQHPQNYSDLEIESAVDRSMAFMARWITPGSVTVDVGAYTGDSSVPMALLSGKTGMCLAFEPNPVTFEVLCRNAWSNVKHFNIVPFNAAVGTKSDEEIFYYSDDGFCNGGRFLTGRDGCKEFPKMVKCINLADVLAPIVPDKVAYIKTDTEGNDLSVLKSISDFIARSKCVIQVELFPDMNRNERLALLEFMASFQFKPCELDGNDALTTEVLLTYSKVRDVLFVR